MSTIEEIMDASRPIEDIIRDLKKKSIQVMPWSELEKEYDPKMHPVNDKKTYPDKVVDGEIVKMSRISLGLQKLATKRMAELCFGIPVKRVYNAQNDEQQQAANIIEAILTKNRIDNINLDRAKKIYAGCEFATIWYAQDTPTMYAGISSPMKLRCKTYSPMQGDSIYPLFDDFDDMIALSVAYARTVGQQTYHYFETYTANEHMRWYMDGESVWHEDMDRELIYIEKIAGVYANRSEPIWENESSNVYEAEWTLSRNGNYIRKNAIPNWVVCCDIDDLREFQHEREKSTNARNTLYYPKDAKVGYETWNQATESIKFHIEQIKANFFSQLQLPDMSFESMKTMPMSGEARKMMFIDAQLKVLDEQGMWIEVFSREVNVIKAFAKLMFPKFASAFDALDVEFTITPYQINDDESLIKNLATACGGKQIMSQRTAIERLGEVGDPDEELLQIQKESANALEESYI